VNDHSKTRTYTTDGLRSDREEDLKEQVDLLIKQAAENTTSGADRALFLFQAQLPLNELARRDQEKQTKIMVACTKWITAMTAVMTIAALLMLGR